MTLTIDLPIDSKSKTKRRIETRKKTIAIPVSIGVVISFLLLLSVAGFHTFLVSAQQEVDYIEGQILKEKTISQELRMEVAELKKPERIRSAAEGRFGMLQPPSRKQIKPVLTLPSPIGNPFRR